MTQSAQELFEVVEDLRLNIEEAYTNSKWANDNQFAQSYRQLAIVAVGEFPGDPIIGLLQTTIPQEFDLLMGRDPSCVTSWVRMQVGRLAIRLSQLARRQTGSSLRELQLPLGFMTDDNLRFIAGTDFSEAQRAYAADAPKAAAIMCGSALEAMLLDALQRPDVMGDTRFQDALNQKSWSEVNWDRVGLFNLLEIAAAVEAIRPTTLRLASSVKDFRDTVHAQAERRAGLRATVGDANVLINIVPLVASDMETHFSGS